jgi:hypothetical protein
LKIKEFVVLVIFGFVGQLGCWASMMGSQAVTTLDNALIIHAISAPIIFTIVSVIYFKKFNYTTPLLTAITFVTVVVLMDFFVVALLINQSFDMFFSPIGTWIPFALIFISTYGTGFYIKKTKLS